MGEGGSWRGGGVRRGVQPGSGLRSGAQGVAGAGRTLRAPPRSWLGCYVGQHLSMPPPPVPLLGFLRVQSRPGGNMAPPDLSPPRGWLSCHQGCGKGRAPLGMGRCPSGLGQVLPTQGSGWGWRCKLPYALLGGH